MDSTSEQTEYDRVFKLLEPGSESTEAAFQQCRLKMVKFFSWKHCPDPANLADETIVRLLKNVNQGQLIRAEKPYSYLYAIAVNVFHEYQRASAKHPPLGDDIVVAAETVEPADDCRELCLENLSASKLKLLNQYYDLNRDQLAGRLQLTPNALRVKIHRIKQELRDCCEACRKRSAR